MSKRADTNKQNALKSTGPRTAAGRRRSSRNAIKHGLCALANLDLSEMDGLGGTVLLSDRALRQQYAQHIAYAAMRDVQASIEDAADLAEPLARLASLERYRRPIFRAWLSEQKQSILQNEPSKI